MTRVRFRFTKLGKVRFTSHRDVARMWERALRRLQLPVAYTEGFSPRPKLAFGLALSTGHESVAEYLDVAFAGGDADADLTVNGRSVDELPARLSPALPSGIDVLAAAVVPPGTGSLQETVTSSSWRMAVRPLTTDHAHRLVEAALAADELVLTRQRKGRDVTDDLRPAVLSLAVAGSPDDGSPGDTCELVAELAVHPRSVRPAELLAVLSPDSPLEEVRVVRTAQWFWHDGARHEPLPAAAPDATLRPHAEARAS